MPRVLTGAENVAERLKGFFRNHICSEQNIVDTAAFCNGAMNSTWCSFREGYVGRNIFLFEFAYTEKHLLSYIGTLVESGKASLV